MQAAFLYLIWDSSTAYRSDQSWSGKAPGPAHYNLVSWLFLRVLALIYIAAFASMALQIEGLVGSEGILPIASKLSAIRESIGAQAYWLYPTLFWLDASDPVLTGACVAGVVSGVAVLFNQFTRLALIICYVLYLSIFYAGQDFTSFQWDLFLLEAGFLAIFLCGGSFIVVLLYRWLLFRFMFLGGMVKIASGDPNWRDLTALAYHYETQPLPSPLAWYAHQLPLWVHQLSVAGVFLIELVIPFCVFMPRRLREFAAWSFILLQSIIILTGNYNFFNLLAISLCLFLFDDTSVARLIGPTTVSRIRSFAPNPGRVAAIMAALLASTVLISNATLAWSSNSLDAPPQPLYALMEATLILGIANTYGPFAVMTTRRGEIEIEASTNGADWFPYKFKYKPGELNMNLTWLIPHQPRLDWQMWFAALRPGDPPYWFNRLMNELAKANPTVNSLFQSVPFPGQKPRFIRAKFYQYRYTDPDQRRSTGRIWKSDYLGLYWPPE
ncbi:MAG: lipase maturation factor family protein [Methylococcaceae bacterium]|nr:lipase maturation factor family protein [Methylococcaceae bacterium]